MAELLSLAIFGSFIWFCIITGVFLLLLFISEGIRQGSLAFAATAGFLVVNYYWGNLPIAAIFNWKLISVYLLLGFIYALIRVYFYGRSQKGKEKDFVYYDLKGNVFRWWFIWPISLISWLASGLLADIWDWIYDRFEGLFKYFFELGRKSK